MIMRETYVFKICLTFLGDLVKIFFVAQVAELVDALVSGASPARGGGSSPFLGTKEKIACLKRFFY